ncbi:MAG: hypothetical protein EOL88_08460 [Bacteroidia bacterium]|nr:alginate export family protein [Bacteroidales bacterium]NCD42109.1 hypothetical protein [Bacteroidia bacterium]MDD2322693.1 alginate export family protein [Bacteroidales bacterium]MDD3010677.1 alginate export family protein [Bacteroidales bacterium]MDD3961708.1 alginate export family protein [Bacteroidales bacterium]
MKRFFLIFFFCGLIVAAFAQTELEIEIRPRVLFDKGYKAPLSDGEKLAISVSQRSSLALLHAAGRIAMCFDIRDVRVWGDDDRFNYSGMFGNTSGIAVYRAWVALKPTESLQIKVGRQTLNYDDQRILSNRGWNDYQITYDALLIGFSRNNHTLDLGTSYNNQKHRGDSYSPLKIKNLNLLHYAFTKPAHTFSLISVVSGNTKSDTTTALAYTSTLGAGAIGNPGDWRYQAYFYLQKKHDPLWDGLAWCLSLNGGFHFTEGKIGARIGADILSGATNSASTFDLLYGKRHGFYGYMDYFNRIPEQGLEDYYLSLEYQLAKPLRVMLDLHYFELQHFQPASSTASPGSEADLTLKWYFSEATTIQGGYSVFLPTSTMQVVYPAATAQKMQHFIYLMITAKPRIKL